MEDQTTPATKADIQDLDRQVIQLDTKVDGLDKKIGQLDTRVDQLERRLTEVASSFDSKLMNFAEEIKRCLLYTSPSPRDRTRSRMPSSA